MSLSNYQCGGRVENKRLVLTDERAFREAMWRMKDGDVVISVEHAESKRSAAANRYLWGPIYSEIEKYTGQSKEDIHNEMCARFTTKALHYTNPATGAIVELEVVQRTSGMTVSDFHRFVEQVKLFAQEFFGLTFEEPGEDYMTERTKATAREARAEAKRSAA